MTESRPRLISLRSFAPPLALLLVLVSVVPAHAVPPRPADIDVIVRELRDADSGPERAVAELGGRVGDDLEIIGGFAATVPADSLAALRRQPGVLSVTADRPLQLHATTYDADKDYTSMLWVAGEITGAGEYWNDGYTGKGVGVALIDSGVVPVDGLRRPGKVVHGPDLSFEAHSSAHRNLDTFGHGTHMAGIIAGRDDKATQVVKGKTQYFLGMAPDARLISVKVADSAGATDVSQVIAAIDWVVQHKNQFNIRVLNLSFGTDSMQDYRVDPLSYAAEVAWRRGIVVVASAGNDGSGLGRLNSPASDPFVIAVGGADGNGTYDVVDDTIRDWSSTGDENRTPDLVAPGASITSLRDPGSRIDVDYPNARTGQRFFRGTGTSQAAAVVSGAVALVLQQRPTLTPDQVKHLLVASAQRLPKAHPVAQGAGMVDLKRARDRRVPSVQTATQTHEPSTGLGALHQSRGTSRVEGPGGVLTGEFDVFGGVWEPATWTQRSLSATAWQGGEQSATGFVGGTWNGRAWAPEPWVFSGSLTRRSWSGAEWSGSAWPDDPGTSDDMLRRSWSRRSWSSDRWGQ